MVELPLALDVPDGWVPLDPAESGAPGAALVIVLPTPEGEFTPNITVGVGEPASTVDLHGAVDAAVGRDAHDRARAAPAPGRRRHRAREPPRPRALLRARWRCRVA